MSEGPLGGPRPFVETRLKYAVTVSVPGEVYNDPPKATEALNVGVNTPMDDVLQWVKRSIGKVILAVNNLAGRSRFRRVAEEVEPAEDGSEVKITWVYVIDGAGMGEAANTTTYSRYICDLHTVLVEGNDDPITRSQAIREFDTGPLTVEGVQIHT